MSPLKRTPGFLFLLTVLCASGAAAFGQERFRQRPPAPDPRPELGLPSVDTVTLSNGLRLSVVYRDGLPFMSLQLVIFAGDGTAPARAPGLATLAAGQFGQGTLLLSAADIEERIEAMGGTFSAKADQDVIQISFHFLDEHLDAALALVGQMILQPKFGDREVNIVKSSVIAELNQSEREPEFVARRHLFRLLFQDHPYERSAFTRDALKTWTARELVDFWNRTLRPNNAHILLSGAINLNVASRKVSHVLNTWAPREPLPSPSPPPRPPQSDRICFIDVPYARSCAIFAGTILPPLVPGETFALLVLNQILGGTPNDRLFMNLRESKGYAFWAYSRPEFYQAGGTFTLQALVNPESLFPAVQELFREARFLARDAPTQVEVDAAKSHLLGGFPIRIERFDDFAGYLAGLRARGAGEEMWSRYEPGVLDVEAERVLQAGRKYLTQPFIVVIAGSHEACREGLRDFELVEIFDSRGHFQYTVGKERS